MTTTSPAASAAATRVIARFRKAASTRVLANLGDQILRRRRRRARLRAGVEIVLNDRHPLFAPCLPNLLDQARKLVGANSLRTREQHQLLRARQHQPALRRTSNSDPLPPPELQHALVPQLMKGTKHRIGVHTKDRPAKVLVQVASRRSPGLASPAAIARRSSAATWSCRVIGSE